MLNKMRKLWWVFHSFFNPFTFLAALYGTGKGRAVLRMRNGLEIEVRRNRWDASIIMEMFYDCPYLKGVSLGLNAVVVDIGCYLGDFSLLVAHAFGARVVAFEAFRDNYQLAKSNIERNRLEGLIALHNLAIGDGTPITLYIRHHDEEVHVTSEPGEGVQAEQVPSLGLRDALVLAGNDIDLLKIDCEGFEYAIFDTIDPHDLSHVKAVSLEYHCVEGWKAKLPRLKRKLSDAGFHILEQPPYLFCNRVLRAQKC